MRVEDILDLAQFLNYLSGDYHWIEKEQFRQVNEHNKRIKILDILDNIS